MNALGERFKEMRKALHITQADLGAVIGIQGVSVAKIESGASKPTEAAIKLICQTYHVNYAWLTTGEGKMLAVETPETMIERLMVGESQLAINVMKAFAALPIDEWRRLRDMIDRVKEEGLSE